MAKTRAFYLINSLTLYRLFAAPVLVLFVFAGMERLFAWLLAFSFFTDLIDGYLARKFGVASEKGAKLDSIADDLTILAGVIGLMVFKAEFVKEIKVILYLLLGLFVLQNIVALIKYKKITSFHTYAAKAAAIFQGTFLILIFFLPQPVYILFYIAAVITAYELIEEIIITIILPAWRTNVKGLYWVLKKKNEK